MHYFSIVLHSNVHVNKHECLLEYMLNIFSDRDTLEILELETYGLNCVPLKKEYAEGPRISESDLIWK